jgi:hypothetical protein
MTGAERQGESEFPRGMVAIPKSKMIQRGLAGVICHSIGPEEVNGKSSEKRRIVQGPARATKNFGLSNGCL